MPREPEFSSKVNGKDADPWAFISDAVSATVETDLEVLPSFFETVLNANGSIRNIHGDNLSVGHLFRATFDGMADIFYDCACSVWPERSWRNLVFSGGVAFKLKILREVIRARFDIEYRLSPFPEDTLFGLLALARAFSGGGTTIEEAGKVLRPATKHSKV